MATKTTTGIRERHARSCGAPAARCSCTPTLEAFVFDRRAIDPKTGRRGAKIRKSFPTITAARQWRADALGSVRRGTMRAPAPITLREAADVWLEGAKDGSVRTRSGDAYKPSAIRSYEAALKNRILPDLGSVKLADIRRADLQLLADKMLAEGKDASTIRNQLMPLRAIFRRACGPRGEVAVNPTTGLELPAVRGRRDRVASPDEAAALVDAIGDDDRAVWATALYAGLRLGELLALQWDDIDVAGGVIHVRRSYDPKARIFVAPKSRAGVRKVPIAAALRLHLLERKARCPWSSNGGGLVFGRSETSPFDYWALVSRAKAAWKAKALAPIGLHEARHTFASLMIAAGVNAKALSTVPRARVDLDHP